MESPIEFRLKQLIKDERVIPMVGAGVSRAVAGLPSWKELLINGLSHAESLNLCKEEIEKARAELDKNELLSVGQTLKSVLDRQFKTFLKHQFDSPEIKDDSLLHSILNLNAPFIITTNYDDLLGKKAKLDHITDIDWMDYEKANGLIRRKQKFVFHIHGYYENADSVILSTGDYDNQNQNDGYLQSLKEIARNYHFLFIGCSQDGVLDEGFTLLFDFFSKWFPKSENEHFFLSLDPNEKTSKTLIQKANICALSYGKEHKDLPDFLNRITPEPKKRNQLILADIKSNGLSLGLEDIDRGSERFEEFKENIAEYNKNTADKKGSFDALLSIIKNLSKGIGYEKVLDMWNHSSNIKKENIPVFIHIAVQSHNLLRLIPNDFLNDLLYARTGIHVYFFDGYLTGFIREYEMKLEMHKENYIDYIKDDKYFFENLHRIVRSLDALVNISTSDIYPDFSEKFIQFNTPKEDALIVTTNKAIYFRSQINLKEIYAKCEIAAASKMFVFKGAKAKMCTFLYDNALFSFSVSNPNDVFLIFPKSANRRILNYTIQGLDEDFLIKIFEENNWSLYLNKLLIEEHRYPSGHKVEFSSNDREAYYIYCHGSLIIHELGTHPKNTTLVKVSSNIRENILSLDIEQIIGFYHKIYPEGNLPSLENHVLFELEDAKVTKLSDIPYLIVRVYFGFTAQFLLFFNISNRNSALTKSIKLKKNSICYDIVNGKDLLIGYLDTTQEESLVDIIAEYLPDFMEQDVEARLFLKDKTFSRFGTQDVYSFVQVSANVFLLSVEGVALYRIDTSTSQSQLNGIDLLEDERIISIVNPSLFKAD